MYDLDDCLERAAACTTNAEALVEVVEGEKGRLLLLFKEGERWRDAAEQCRYVSGRYHSFFTTHRFCLWEGLGSD